MTSEFIIIIIIATSLQCGRIVIVLIKYNAAMAVAGVFTLYGIHLNDKIKKKNFFFSNYIRCSLRG